MSGENYIHEVTVNDGENSRTYEVLTRIGWLDQDHINDVAGNYVYVLDTKQIRDLEQLQQILGGDYESAGYSDGELRIEFKENTPAWNMARLKARLPGMTNKQIAVIPLGHQRVLLKWISAFEAEEETEVRELLEGNPTEMPSRKLSILK